MKILIGCPTYEIYDDLVDEWVTKVKKIIEFSKNLEVNYLLVDNSKTGDFFNKQKAKGINIIKAPYEEDVRERVVNSRNILRKKALEEGYDYFFSLEQDLFPEEDILQKLLDSKKEIISAYYGKPVNLTLKENETGEIRKATVEFPLVWVKAGEKLKRALPQEVLKKGIIEVGGFGIGCLLINRKVLEKIKFRYPKNAGAFDDMMFCLDSKKLGYKLFLDSDIRVEHKNKQWDRETV